MERGRMDRGPICPFCTVSLAKSALSCDVCGSMRCSRCTVMMPPHHVGPCPTCYSTASSQWRCSACTFINTRGQAGKSPCDACGLVGGQAVAPVPPTPPPPAPPAGRVVAAVPVPSADWTCDICTCKNSRERRECVACGELREKPSTTAKSSSSAALRPQMIPLSVVSSDREQPRLRGSIPSVVTSGDATVEQKLLAEVDAIRSLCRTAKSYFVDLLNPLEMSAYHWESAMGDSLGYGPVETLLPSFLKPKKSLSIFPREGPKAEDVCQGELGDCWFLCVVAVLAESQPSLISSLFLLKEINPEGVFALKLWKDGDWSAVVIDATFPTVFNGTMFKFAHCRKPTDLWVPLLEKAYAKICGGYQNIESGCPIDAFYDLTGMPCVEFRNGGDDGAEDAQWTQDEMIPQLASYCSANCVISACCGGTSRTMKAASALGLVANHAYSVLCVDVDPTSGNPVVTIRNPWGRSHQPGSNLGGRVADGGIARLSFPQFAAAFSTVTICITRNFLTAICIPGVRCSSTAVFSTANPHQLAFTVCETAEVYVLAAQPDARRTGRKYFDVLLMLCRYTATGVTVVAANKSCCSRVSMAYGMLDPGRYCIVPFSLQCDAPLNVTLLSESRHVSFSPSTAGDVASAAYPAPFIPGLLLDAGNRWGKVTRYPQGFMDVMCISFGTMYMLFVKNKDRGAVTATVNASQSHGIYIVGCSGVSMKSTAVIPAGKTGIVVVGSVLPTTGGYSCSFGWEYTAVTGGAANQIGRGLFAPF